MAAAAARSLLRSSASLLRAAPPPARSPGVGASRASIRRALAAPPRRLPVEASWFCLESLLPLHSATAAARLKSMLAVPGTEPLGWLTKAQGGLNDRQAGTRKLEDPGTTETDGYHQLRNGEGDDAARPPPPTGRLRLWLAVAAYAVLLFLTLILIAWFFLLQKISSWNLFRYAFVTILRHFLG